MISDEYINLCNEDDLKNDPKMLMKLNEHGAKLESVKVDEQEKDFFKNLKEIHEKYVPSILKESFQWTQPIGVFCKNFFTDFSELNFPLFYEFGNMDYLAKNFTQYHVRIFTEVKIGRVGGSVAYDETMRSLSRMLKFFLNIHVKKFLIYKPRLKTNCVHLYDPCYRERVRMRNRNDLDISNKYNNDDFDLKRFIFLCLNKLFPNVSWRWIGGKQFAHLMVLKIIVKMFEYGLWRIEDLDTVLEKTYMVAEILINLEKYTDRDCKKSSFSSETAKEWSLMATSCRVAIASIYLHIAIMYYDYNIMNALPQFGLNPSQFFASEPLYKPQSFEDPDTLFKLKNFKRKRFYTYIGFLLACLFCKVHEFRPHTSKNFSNKLDVLVNLIITYITQNRNSFFYVSLDTFQPQNLPFYLLADHSSVYLEPNSYVNRFKQINEIIRTHTMDQVSADKPDFIQQIKDIFKDINVFFSQSFKSKEQHSAYQLSFVMAEIPHYVLSLINLFISLDFKEQDKKAIMRDGFAVLLHLAKSNTQTVTNLFSGYNFDHIRDILSKDKIHSTYFFAKIFNQSSAFPIIEGNQEVFDKIISAFEITFTAFISEFKVWVTDPAAPIDLENLTSFIILNKLFKSLLSNNTLKNHRFEIVFSSRMGAQYLELLRTYAQTRIDFTQQTTKNPPSFYKFNSILRHISDWNSLGEPEKKLIINEVFNRSLKVFALSVSRVATPPIFDSFYPAFKNDLVLDKFVYLLDTEVGQRIFGTIIELFKILVIFYQNTLLNLGQVECEDVKNYKQDYLTAKQVDPWISSQLVLLCKPLGDILETKGINGVLKNFLLKDYIPAIFKYISGLFSHMSDEEFVDINPQDRKQIFKNMKRFAGLVNMIEKCFVSKDGEKTVNENSNQFLYNFITNQRTKNPIYCFPKSFYDTLDEVRDFGSELMIKLSSLYLWDESKVENISSYIRFDNNSFQEKAEGFLNERLEGHMVDAGADYKQAYHAKRVAWRKVKTSAKQYEEMQIENNQMAERTFNVIKYFDFEIFSDQQFVMYTQSMEEDIELKAKGRMVGNWIEVSKIEAQQRLAIKVVNYIKIRYLYIKDYFIKRPQMNQILHVLKMEDVIKNNVQNLIEFFVYKITLMDADFKQPEQSYLTTDTYKLLLILMDTLIRSSRNYRQAFYNYVKQGQGAVVHRIFSIHKYLANFVTYKTFIDNNWCEMYVWYHLFSNFLQNLCEDNFADFKNWFFQEKLTPDGTVSLLIDYNSLLERAFKYNELADVDKEYMRINDRPEMIMVYERLLVGITEFVNGGKTLGQAVLYEKQIDIWVGITLRVIDNVDSKFYQLKDAIVTYLTAIVDGESQGPVDFIASNFSASGIFKLMIRLIKKLYIRQFLLKKERKKKFWNRNSAKKICLITAEEEEKCSNISFDTLIEYYKKYDETFSEHVIINTVVSLYSFLSSLGEQVVRYENFIKELNIIKDSIFVYKRKFKNETYDLTSITIWHFISKIIVELEIRYKDKFSDEKEPKLILHRFKKLPICFFLTLNVKDEFMENVNVDSLDFKHEEFFDKSKDHLIIMGDLRKIFIKSKMLYYTSTNDAFMWFMKAVYLICILINIMFLFLYNKTRFMFKSIDPSIFDQTIDNIAIIHAGISFALLLYWFLMKYQTVLKIEWESYFTTRSRKKKVPLLHRFKVQIINSIAKITVPRNFFLHGLLSVLGRVVNPFFYTLMLLLVVDLSILANSVVISFVQNYDKLGYTLLMILFVINFFAYVAADYFEDAFDSEVKSQFICNTYFSCLMNSLDIGVRTGGGIADKMNLEGSTESSYFGGRFLFDVIFFILINVILLGIFFGIIVDSFKSYRDEMVKRARDQQNVCFTCGLSKTTLEKSGIEFDKHLEEHDIWNYFFYTIYLKWKPVNSYDGVDIYVDENLESNNRAGWMPIMTTMKYEKRIREINQEL